MEITLHPPPPLLSLAISDPRFPSSSPIGSSLKITLPPTLTHFQLPSWQCFRFGSHRSPPFCSLSMTHCTLGYFSPQAQIKQLCSLAQHQHPTPPPLLCYRPTHPRTHMRTWISDEGNVNKSALLGNQALCEGVFWSVHIVITALSEYHIFNWVRSGGGWGRAGGGMPPSNTILGKCSTSVMSLIYSGTHNIWVNKFWIIQRVCKCSPGLFLKITFNIFMQAVSICLWRFWQVRTGTRWCTTGFARRAESSTACGRPSTSSCSPSLETVSSTGLANVFKWPAMHRSVQVCATIERLVINWTFA